MRDGPWTNLYSSLSFALRETRRPFVLLDNGAAPSSRMSRKDEERDDLEIV